MFEKLKENKNSLVANLSKKKTPAEATPKDQDTEKQGGNNVTALLTLVTPKQNINFWIIEAVESKHRISLCAMRLPYWQKCSLQLPLSPQCTRFSI